MLRDEVAGGEVGSGSTPLSTLVPNTRFWQHRAALSKGQPSSRSQEADKRRIRTSRPYTKERA